MTPARSKAAVQDQAVAEVAEIRPMADYEEAQMIVAFQAEVATRPFEHDPTACGLSEYFCVRSGGSLGIEPPQ